MANDSGGEVAAPLLGDNILAKRETDEVSITVRDPQPRLFGCPPCNTPTWGERAHNSLENNVLPFTVFGGIGFFAPKAMEWLTQAIPGPLFALFPLINAALGAGGVSYLKAATQFICCRTASDKEKVLHSFPRAFQDKLAELEQRQEYKSDRAKLFASVDMVLAYSALFYLIKYQPTIAATITPYLPPVATPALVAVVCYAIGRAIFACIDCVQGDEYRVTYSKTDIEAAMGELQEMLPSEGGVDLADDDGLDATY